MKTEIQKELRLMFYKLKKKENLIDIKKETDDLLFVFFVEGVLFGMERFTKIIDKYKKG